MRDHGRNQLSASIKNLRRLFWLRNVMILFLSSTVLVLLALDLPLRTLPIGIAIGSMMLLNGLTWLRLKSVLNVSEGEFLAQLLGDIATLTGLFYFTGGYTNPFIWMYLLPLAVAAVALTARYVWLIATLAVVCYSSLVFFSIPLAHLHLHSHDGEAFDIHMLGMWLGFVVSSGLIAVFVTRIGQNLRDYDRLVAETREKALESERMLALGALATGAAHELGTPLSTMAVVAGEMANDFSDVPELTSSLTIFQTQIRRCKDILGSITASADQQRAEDRQAQALDEYLDQIVARWQDTHPATRIRYSLVGKNAPPMIRVDRTLRQALVNLLNNAAEASPATIDISVQWDDLELQFTIRDFGPGLSPELAKKVGTPFFTTKAEKGMGLGVYLSRVILERFGGTVSLNNHPQGGSVAAIRLPLKELTKKPHESEYSRGTPFVTSG